MFHGVAEGPVGLERGDRFLPATIDPVEQRLERREIIRYKKPMVVANARENETRHVHRLDLMLLIDGRLALRSVCL